MFMINVAVILYSLQIVFTQEEDSPIRHLPDIPDTYYTGIEVKARWHNRSITYVAREYRDGNRFAYHFEFDWNNNNNTESRTTNQTRWKKTKTMSVFFNFDNNVGKTVDLTDGRKTCRHVFNTTKYRQHHPDMLMVDRPAVTTTQLFGQVDTINYTYMGLQDVRNISCHYWQRTEENETVLYYFRELKDGSMTLIRISEANTMLQRHTIYDYFGFEIKVPSWDEIQPPLGTYCSAIQQHSAPPNVTAKMTFSIEYKPLSMRRGNFTNQWLVVGFKTYWDATKGLKRNDHHIKIDGKWTPVKDIIDFENGIRYEHFTRENCSMLKYENLAIDRLPFFHNRGHWIAAMDAFEHLQLYRNDYVYEGERFVRGIPTDVWIFKSDDLGQNGFNEIEWYFTKRNVTEVSSLGIGREKQVPVRIVGYYGNKTKQNFEMDIFNFKHDVDDEDFKAPIRECLKMSRDLYTIQLFIVDLPNDHMYYVKNYLDFEQSLLDILKEYAGNKDEDDGRFLIEVTFGKSTINVMVSIVDLPFRTEDSRYVSAKAIAEKIEYNVLHSRVSYQYSVNDTSHTAMFVKAYFDSNRVEYISKESNNDNKNSIIIAILIVLIFVGFSLGLILMFALLKWRLEKNGHHLKKMLRRKQTLENEENDDGAASTSATTQEELHVVATANNNIDEDVTNKDDRATIAVVQSDLKPGEEDIPL